MSIDMGITLRGGPKGTIVVFSSPASWQVKINGILTHWEILVNEKPVNIVLQLLFQVMRLQNLGVLLGPMAEGVMSAGSRIQCQVLMG